MDALFHTITDYVFSYDSPTASAMETARLSLMDGIGCAILALQYPACTALLGPVVPGTMLPVGARVLGTSFVLDPILAAFNIGTLVRWLDFNDTWLAAEWGHPSDNLGAILAVMDYLNRAGQRTFQVKDILLAMIKAYEIQGILALENSFNRLGFDHVILVKIASTAVAMQLLGGSRDHIAAALSQAFLDGPALRTYRHTPNTGSRKSWAAGDATSRAVRLAWLTLQGQQGYASALTAKRWGFNEVIMKGDSLKITRPLGCYVMEHILFKVAYPAEFHAQTAVECAVTLHGLYQNKLDAIEKIILSTHESAMRIIDKTGPLYNAADRDHCLQYMVAVALLQGDLKAVDYENHYTTDARVDALRAKMVVIEESTFSKDYLDPDKRSIANSMQIFFTDGTASEKIVVEYPIGHKRRRVEATPLLYQKYQNNLATLFPADKVNQLLALFQDHARLDQLPVDGLMDAFSVTEPRPRLGPVWHVRQGG
ncbi:MAG TPA: bifunctional 2-methylcitrate dehydratase/aconitate hydratase [Gammaproteobacteria bacterium]|jgi:2-methylcitrate dehydratase|nr:bifunctional 2-methylcitrate dehydratase/aconitate hydratase [Gammaproteobacteria bacterium]